MRSISNSLPLWAVGTPLGLSSLVGDLQTEVCVVGLGGSGLSCVLELGRLGVRAVGIDAAEVAGGAAGSNGGFLLAGLSMFYHEAIMRFGRARARAIYGLTLDEMDRMTEDTPAAVERMGSLRIAESVAEERDCALQLAAMRADGLSADAYRGAEGDGLLVHGDGTFQPVGRCRTVATHAIVEGALLFERSPALDISSGTVRTPHGTISAKRVVVAVDGSLDVLLPELAKEVRTARLQMLATGPTREVAIPRPVYARWGYDYWQQRPDGVIAMGGARDIAGEAEWTHERHPTDQVQQALEKRLRVQLGVSAPVTHRWAASVGYTVDGLPIAREVRGGVWAIGGYSGTGNVIGSLLGRGVARVIARNDFTLVRPFTDA